jgi:branched-chain amino acid transport system substrate-binding protein
VPQAGAEAGPERFYTEDARNFLRLVPPDSAQAGPLVAVARAEGVSRIALAHDGGVFGRQLAGGVEQAAADQGVEVTTVERVEPDLDEAASLARQLAEDDPEAVIYLGIGGDPAETLLAAMASRELVADQLAAAAPLARPGALPSGEPSRPLRVTSPILPRDRYPAAGRRILDRIAETEPSPPVEALYGYESMRLVLHALRVAGKRATDRVAVIEAARSRGPEGSVIGRYRFDRRGDTSRHRLALYELDRGELEYLGAGP